MNKKVINFLFYIYYIPIAKIFFRLYYILKRKLLENLNRSKYIDYFSFTSNLKIRNQCPQGNLFNKKQKTRSLPININLVGYPFKLSKNIDWYPINLDHGTRLERLNLHYMDYLYELNIKNALFIILKWIREVPPYRENYWRDSWNCYALSIRIVNWIDIISKKEVINNFKNSKSISLINKSIEYQVDFLVSNLELDIKGNHLIKNIRCVFRASSYLSGDKTKKWIKLISKYLLQELKNQVLDDGMHFELSPSYHNLVIEDLLCIRRSFLSLKEEINLTVFKEINNNLDIVIKKMYLAILKLTHPDGYPSLFNDGGLHSSLKPSKIVRYIKKEIKLKIIEENYKSKKTWKLNYAGYYGLSSKNNYFITKCGNFGANSLPAHGQGDSLSFEWSVEGNRIIVDQGVFTYHPGLERDFSRSTKAHNTLTLNDLDQTYFWSSFKAGRRATTKVIRFEEFKNSFFLEAFHDGYKFLRGNPLVFRSMKIEPNKIYFKDFVRSNFKHHVKNRILFAPDIVIKKLEYSEVNKFRCLLVLTKKKNLKTNLEFILQSEVKFKINDTFWYPDFGKKIKTKRIEFDLGYSPCSYNWSIVKI
tara:strand:- start:1231 stop:2997 length:1767 start_codon:yes stop_codon:yes gene_type:complete